MRASRHGIPLPVGLTAHIGGGAGGKEFGFRFRLRAPGRNVQWGPPEGCLRPGAGEEGAYPRKPEDPRHFFKVFQLLIPPWMNLNGKHPHNNFTPTYPVPPPLTYISHPRYLTNLYPPCYNKSIMKQIFANNDNAHSLHEALRASRSPSGATSHIRPPRPQRGPRHIRRESGHISLGRMLPPLMPNPDEEEFLNRTIILDALLLETIECKANKIESILLQNARARGQSPSTLVLKDE